MGNGFWEPAAKKSRSSMGKINGMVQVTPAMIAYAVVQVGYHSLVVYPWAFDGFYRHDLGCVHV
jgi:hypothetical protein